jgi:hypothetical protein
MKKRQRWMSRLSNADLFIYEIDKIMKESMEWKFHLHAIFSHASNLLNLSLSQFLGAQHYYILNKHQITHDPNKDCTSMTRT